MWMEGTRSTIISATVFHKHKYITNPGVTPEKQVMASAGKLVDKLKGRMPPHLIKTTLTQLERIETILKQGWTHKYQKHPPRNPPTLPPNQNCKVQVTLTLKAGVLLSVPRKVSNPHPLLQPPNPAPIATPVISQTITPPRVVPPPRAAHPMTLRQSPWLAAQRSEKKNEEDATSHNTSSKQV